MTDTPRQQTTRTRTTDEIEPMVPLLQREYRTDGGSRRPPTERARPERPPTTDYAEPGDRHREEIEPMVPRLD